MTNRESEQVFDAAKWYTDIVSVVKETLVDVGLIPMYAEETATEFVAALARRGYLIEHA